jgi:hypothetical protein
VADKSSKYEKAKEILETVRDAIFTGDLIRLRNVTMDSYAEDDPYLKARERCEKEVDDIVILLSDPALPIAEMKSTVLTKSPSLQSFLYDRFSYAVECLSKPGKKEFFLSDEEGRYLQFCLLDLWRLREREGDSK